MLDVCCKIVFLPRLKKKTIGNHFRRLLDCRPHVRSFAAGQSAGEGNSLHRHAAAMGHAPKCGAAAAFAPVGAAEEHGAAWVDPHATERIAPVESAGRDDACENFGRTSGMGRRKDDHYYVQFYAGIGLVDGV